MANENEVDESEVEDDNDDDVTLSKAGRVLTSGGQNEAQAYATAELSDAPRRPAVTIEPERVRVIDPRREKTVLTRLPKVTPPADLLSAPQSVVPVPDDVTQDDVTRDEVTVAAGPASTPSPTPPPLSAAPSAAAVPSIAAPPLVASAKPPPRSSSLGFVAAAVAAGVLLAVGARFVVGHGSHTASPGTPVAQPPAATAAAAPAAVTEQAPAPVAPEAPPAATAAVDPPEPASAAPADPVASAEPSAKPAAGPRAHPVARNPAAARPTPPPVPTQAPHRLFGVEN